MIRAHFLHEITDTQRHVLYGHLDSNVELSMGVELENAPTYEILIGGRPTREQVLACSRLKALIIPFAGVPEQTATLMAEFPEVTVHNLHHNAAATAESALMLLLAAAKQILPADRALRDHDWTTVTDPVMVLQDKTALILGYGAIGRRVANMCLAFDMEVLATRRQSERPAPVGAVRVYEADELHNLLPRAHVLLITLPLTPQTKGLIGRDELNLMPPESLLVNVGRGPIVDEGALYEALRIRHLLAAGIDVWYNYPEDRRNDRSTPPSNFPFHELDNVVMSPHRGGSPGTDDVERQRFLHLAELLNVAASGDPIPNRIDLGRGY